MKRIALESGVFKDYPLSTALAHIKRIGYDAIELASRRTYSHFEADKLSDSDVQKVRNQLLKFEIKVCAVFTYGNHMLGWPEEERRKTAVDEMRRAIKNTKALNCDLVVSEMKPGRLQMALSEQPEIERCKQAWKKSVAELIPDLKRTNMRLAFEPHPGDFVEDSDVAVDIIREIDSERIGYLYCFPHTFNFTGKLGEMIRYAGKKLMHVHFGDSHKVEKIVPPYFVKSSPELALRFKREVHEHLIPGHGDIDFREGLSALKRVGYDGYLSLQPFSDSDRPIEAAKESFQYLSEKVS